METSRAEYSETILTKVPAGEWSRWLLSTR